MRSFTLECIFWTVLLIEDLSLQTLTCRTKLSPFCHRSRIKVFEFYSQVLFTFLLNLKPNFHSNQWSWVFSCQLLISSVEEKLIQASSFRCSEKRNGCMLVQSGKARSVGENNNFSFQNMTSIYCKWGLDRSGQCSAAIQLSCLVTGFSINQCRCVLRAEGADLLHKGESRLAEKWGVWAKGTASPQLPHAVF